MSKRLSRSTFLNFIKSYSCRHEDWPMTKIAVEGAKLWHRMCPSDRAKFVKKATVAKNRVSFGRRARGRIGRSASRGRRGRKRKPCCKRRSSSRR